MNTTVQTRHCFHRQAQDSRWNGRQDLFCKRLLGHTGNHLHDQHPDGATFSRTTGWVYGKPEHTHDLGLTISAGDVPAEKMAELVARLLDATNAMVAEFNATSDVRIDAYVSFDGRRDCDLPHPIPQPVND